MARQKLLVISDTHGNIPALEAVLIWAGSRQSDDKINTAVFLGDGLQDLDRAKHRFSLKWIQVRGNNDYAPSVPDATVFEFCGRRLFLCHGHRYRLYDGFDTLIAVARNNEADIALFGHLHVPVFETVGGLQLVNPGSVGWPRSKAGATFAVIDFMPEKPLEVEFWNIGDQGEILEFSP